MPKIVDKGIQIFIKDSSRRKKLGKLFGSADQSKIILISDHNTKQVSSLNDKRGKKKRLICITIICLFIPTDFMQ